MFGLHGLGLGVLGLGGLVRFKPRSLTRRRASVRRGLGLPFQGIIRVMWGFPKIKGTLFGGTHIEDYSILGSILGYPNFGKVPYRV